MPGSPEPGELDPEDAKLVTLARAARARTGAVEGAAVRDETGRTYAAATVDLDSLQLTAVQAAVAAAVSSGVDRLAAAALVSGASELSGADRAVLDEAGVDTVHLAGPDGTVRAAAR